MGAAGIEPATAASHFLGGITDEKNHFQNTLRGWDFSKLQTFGNQFLLPACYIQ